MKKLLLLSVCSLLIFSCTEKNPVMSPADVQENQKTSKDVEIIEGVLKFSSKDHLSNVIKEIGKRKDMTNWYENERFTPLLKRQLDITEQQYDEISNTGEFGGLKDILTFTGSGNETRLEKIVQDPRFAAVLNSGSYVIVADMAYHIGAKQVSQLRVANDAKLVSEFLKNSNMKGVSYVDVVNEELKSARVQNETFEFGKRRFHCEFKRHFAVVYQSLVVRVRYEKKNVIGWSPTDCNSMSLTASGTYTQGSFVIPFSGSASGTWVDQIDYFVDESVGVNSDWLTGTGYAVTYDGTARNFTFYP
jgi:hypothetical protein